MIAVIALLAGAVAGCGNVLERFGVRPTTSTSVEGPALGADAVFAMARPSVVKVRAVAPSCQIHEGTGRWCFTCGCRFPMSQHWSF
jgi:hypothetical protein